ncbi:MAG: small ribosomal subunit Rsm22 family protein, partial [Bradyrhizobium sp.]
MSAPELSADLRSSLEAKLHGLARDEIAARAAQISKTYRDGGKARVIATQTDALAYALVRMPATYAAVAASLGALVELQPDFAPDSLL